MFPSQNLHDQIKVARVMNAVAAGTTDQNGTGIDLAGFDGVLFVAAFGTLTASQVTELKAQQSDDDGDQDDYSDIAGSKVGPLDDDDDNGLLVLDVFRPGKRFVRPVVLRETANAVIDGVTAYLYVARDGIPTTHDSSVKASKVVVTPAEGTA